MTYREYKTHFDFPAGTCAILNRSSSDVAFDLIIAHTLSTKTTFVLRNYRYFRGITQQTYGSIYFSFQDHVIKI